MRRFKSLFGSEREALKAFTNHRLKLSTHLKTPPSNDAFMN